MEFSTFALVIVTGVAGALLFEFYMSKHSSPVYIISITLCVLLNVVSMIIGVWGSNTLTIVLVLAFIGVTMIPPVLYALSVLLSMVFASFRGAPPVRITGATN